MGSITSLLPLDFAPDPDCCERVSIDMGDGVTISDSLLLWAEYECVDDVFKPFLMVIGGDGALLRRFDLDSALNLVPCGLPFVVFPRALTFADDGRPVKVMVDVWASDFYAKKPFVAVLNEGEA